MNNEGYSRSLNAERSGSSASGTYRAPYKPEPLLTGIIFGVCAAVAILVFIFVVRFARFARENLKEGGTTLMLVLAATLAVAILEALVVLTGILLVKIVRRGHKCNYTADEERFITNEGGKIRTVFFRDVQSVNFFSISVFGKDRGYDVNVRLRNKYDEIFSIVSENFISEKSTPFWIIAERIEKIRKEEWQYVKHIPAPGVSDLTVRTQPESISNGKLSDNGQNRDSAMPALNLSAMAAAVSEQEKPSGNTNSGCYIDERGRERPYGEIIGSGRFKVMCSRRKTALLAVIAVAAVVTALYFSYVFIEGLVMMSLSASKLLYMLFVVLIAVLAAVSAVIIFRIGDECSYRANGLEFVVTNKRGGETHIDYKHTQGVYYFYSLLGYKVKILTDYGIITYNCVDKRKRVYKKPEKLPFDLISKNIRK